MTPTTIRPPTGEWWPVIYAKDQPEYLPLRAVRNHAGTVITCWQMTWRERITALVRGKVFLTLLTFNTPLQPVRLDTSVPKFAFDLPVRVGAERARPWICPDCWYKGDMRVVRVKP